jgi:5'-nucleotidase
MSHSIKWPDPIAARRVEIEGATAYAIAGLLASFLSFITKKHFLKNNINYIF